MKNYLIHNDIHINHDMAANTQEASNSIRQGKWLRNPVFIYCCESLGSTLNMSFLDRYLPQLLTMIFSVNNQKKLFFFLFTKIQNRLCQIEVHNEWVHFQLLIQIC